MTSRPTIAIVSPPIQISGGMKQKLLLAHALARAGYNVDVVTPDPTRLRDFDFSGAHVSPDQALRRAPYDVSVVTWFETFELASRLSPNVVHYCQGYEGDLVHLAPRLPEIRAVYERALPTLVVSPHLGLRLKQDFGRPCQVMPPLLDRNFRPKFGRMRPHREPTILVHGIFESAVKRIAPALQAVELLRRRRSVRLCRISALRRSEGEQAPRGHDRFLVEISPRQVAKVTAAVDLTLFTSDAGEGFGLPVLESLAAGIPVVAARIPSLAVFEHMDVISTVDSVDPERLEAAIVSMLDPETWRNYRRRGLAFSKIWRDAQDRRAAFAFRSLVEAG